MIPKGKTHTTLDFIMVTKENHTIPKNLNYCFLSLYISNLRTNRCEACFQFHVGWTQIDHFLYPLRKTPLFPLLTKYNFSSLSHMFHNRTANTFLTSSSIFSFSVSFCVSPW